MNKYKKLLQKTHRDDTRRSSEIVVEKLKDLRKNVYNMTKSEFAAGLFPSYELSFIENYSTYSKKIYIKELMNKYEVDPDVIELSENIDNIVDEMLICILKEEEYNNRVIDKIDKLELESNYALIVRGLNCLIISDEYNLDIIVKKLLNSSYSFDKNQANLLIIISAGSEILKGNYILAYETINLLRKYVINNKYINIMFEYYIAKSCFYCEHNIYTLSYLDSFLINDFSRLTPTKFAEISEYKLVTLINNDIESAIEYGNNSRLLVNHAPFNILTDIINGKDVSTNIEYNFNLFEIITLFGLDKYDIVSGIKITPKKEVEINLFKYLENLSDLTLLRRFILPIYKVSNPYYYNILNIANIDELKSRSRYKEIISYIGFKKPLLKQK